MGMTQAHILCLNLAGAGMDDVARHLQLQGWQVTSATDPAALAALLGRREPIVGLLGVGGAAPQTLELMERCLQSWPGMEWVALCDEVALEGMAFRRMVLESFFDYQVMPLNWPAMQHVLDHVQRRARLRQCHSQPAVAGNALGMVGRSEGMQQLRQAIAKVALTQASVLIGGESGTGKELAARAIHDCSARRARPFVAINCAAVAPSLIQSELFGHERGAFTGAGAQKRGLLETAQGGTLFLDEIGDLPLDLQAHLLRFLQNRTLTRLGGLVDIEVDVRVVAASHVDLAVAVAQGRFREDLFYRLNVLALQVPPLRERIDDVPQLAQHFFAHCAADRPARLQGFSRQALAAMLGYSWPGNVRELYNRVLRAVVMSDARWISVADLGLPRTQLVAGAQLDLARTQAEREAIHQTLSRVGNNITHAARDLGISRMTLYRLMDKHGLAPPAREAQDAHWRRENLR